jgi:hypothetical protein
VFVNTVSEKKALHVYVKNLVDARFSLIIPWLPSPSPPVRLAAVLPESWWRQVTIDLTCRDPDKKKRVAAADHGLLRKKSWGWWLKPCMATVAPSKELPVPERTGHTSVGVIRLIPTETFD